MKRITLEGFLDQKKPLSHISFIIIALAGVVLFSDERRTSGFITGKLFFFLLILIQLEAFIFIARLIFREVNPGTTGKELTKIVLTRFVLFIVICFFAALIIFLLSRYATTWMSGGDVSGVLNYFLDYEFKTWFISTLGGLTFGAIIFIVIQWQDALRREQKLREQNLIFQNETLKNQINPHFLFNSLNTLSSLIGNKPDMAEMFIYRLSSIYRYILENSQKDKVQLTSELAFISEYFNLQRIRDEEKIKLTIDTPEAEKFEILPVSLHILIENAIKHNKATRGNPLEISIFIEGQMIVVKNNLQRMTTQIKSTGIGLKNLSERVRLITGNELKIYELNDFFIVKLPLLR
jgi:two-component system LytT family sensor kinase